MDNKLRYYLRNLLSSQCTNLGFSYNEKSNCFVMIGGILWQRSYYCRPRNSRAKFRYK